MSTVDATAAPIRKRRAWSPEAGDEVAGLLRQLALTPWLTAGRDDELIAAVRRNEATLRSAIGRLGWVLVVERDLVRLRKSAPPRPATWAADGPKPLVCSWFFLLVAGAESMPPRTALGKLVGAARAAAAECGLPVLNDIEERRAIVAALRQLDLRGVIITLDGEPDDYVRDEASPVLLAIHHTRLAHVLANPGALDPSLNPVGWLAQAHREDDPAKRMRRRLVDDTCVHLADLDPAEASWLSQRVRGDDGAPLAAAYGLTLERRAEGAAFVVPEGAFRHPRDLGPLPFPTPGTVAHAALMLCDEAAARGATEAGPGPGWRTLTEAEVGDAVIRFAEQQSSGRGGWSAELVAEPDVLVSRVAALLEGTNLLRRTPDWQFAPTTGRWSAAAETSPRRKR